MRGCLFQHITYAAELRVKENRAGCICSAGQIASPFLSIAGADQRSRYRNKAQYPFGIDEMVCQFIFMREEAIA